MKLLKAIALSTTFSLLTACGGGGGGDEDPQARILEAGDKDYAEELAISAGEGSKSLASSESGGFTPVAFVGEEDTILDKLKQSLTQPVDLSSDNSPLSSLPLGVQETSTKTEKVLGNCGGYYEDTTTTTVDAQTLYPFQVELSLNYVDYCTGNETNKTITNGNINVITTASDESNSSQSVSYNLSSSSTSPYGPQSLTRAGSETCNTVNGVKTCSSSSEPYTASSGVIYTFENANVSGNNSSGYNIEGDLTDNQGNSFNVNVEGLTQCDSGNISSGTITITSSTGEVVSVTFPNCSECVISYAGNAWTIPQP